MPIYKLNTTKGAVQIDLNDIKRTDGGVIEAKGTQGHFTETNSSVTMRNGDVHYVNGMEYGHLIGTLQRLGLVR